MSSKLYITSLKKAGAICPCLYICAVLCYGACLVFVLEVRTCIHNILEYLHQLVHINIAYVERLRSEADNIGITEIRHHSRGFQCLVDTGCLRVFQCHTTAAMSILAGIAYGKSVGSQLGIYEIHEICCQIQRFCAHLRVFHVMSRRLLLRFFGGMI